MNIDSVSAALKKPAVRRCLVAGLALVAAAGAFGGGVLVGRRSEARRPSFHDMRVNHVADLTALVDPADPAVRSLAKRLGAPEAAYAYVRDRIRDEFREPAEPPGDILRDGTASCLGKATLLCSLYRAMGIPAEDVRVVAGAVVCPEGPAEHAWIDLEYGGVCLQQDPSGFLGKFDFWQFRDLAFTRSFVFDEDFCFNETGLAEVSQLNRFRDELPEGMGGGR